MSKSFILALGLSATALAGCDGTGLTADQQAAVGAVAGGAAGLITADALDANDNFTILAGLGGAAAGTLVARNNAEKTCAYSNGDGTYSLAPCP